MKINCKFRQMGGWLSLLTSLIVTSVVDEIRPTRAATLLDLSDIDFLSLSEIQLRIDNFNRFPLGVAADGDVKTINIANVGIVETDIQGSAFFIAEQTTVFAEALFQNLIAGFGSEFETRTDISSILLGEFALSAQETLSFDLQSSILLNNISNNLIENKTSSSGNIRVALQDRRNQTEWDIFRILGALNTNANPQFHRDLLKIDFNSGLQITDYSQQMILEENQEFLEFSLRASFELSVEEDTEILLIAETQSCAYASNQLDVCVNVSEPSNQGAMILGLGWLICVGLFPRMLGIMNHIVKLTGQPFLKHFIKEFPIKLRR